MRPGRTRVAKAKRGNKRGNESSYLMCSTSIHAGFKASFERLPKDRSMSAGGALALPLALALGPAPGPTAGLPLHWTAMRIVFVQTNTPTVQGVSRESTPFWRGRGDGGMATFPKTHFKF